MGRDMGMNKGEENHDQNILNEKEKNPFSRKIKILK